MFSGSKLYFIHFLKLSNMRNLSVKCSLIFVLAFAYVQDTWAKRPEFVLELKNNLFYPAEITIPANTKVKLIIHNKDATPEEFDSFALNREKVIFAHKKAVIFIGPIPPGRYDFFGEYHPNSAKGTIIVVDTIVKDANHAN